MDNNYYLMPAVPRTSHSEAVTQGSHYTGSLSMLRTPSTSTHRSYSSGVDSTDDRSYVGDLAANNDLTSSPAYRQDWQADGNDDDYILAAAGEWRQSFPKSVAEAGPSPIEMPLVQDIQSIHLSSPVYSQGYSDSYATQTQTQAQAMAMATPTSSSDLAQCSYTELFDMVVGDIEQAARDATDQASALLRGGKGSYAQDVGLKEAVRSEEQRVRQKQSSVDQTKALRKAVQNVLYRSLYHIITDGGEPDVAAKTQQVRYTILSATYELQHQLPKRGTDLVDVPNVSFLATAAILQGLQKQFRLMDDENSSGNNNNGNNDGSGMYSAQDMEATSAEASSSSTMYPAGSGTGYDDQEALSHSRYSSNISKAYVCTEPGCGGKSFRRPADLERHKKMLHGTYEEKPRYPCDYRKCARHKNPFHRQDHFRDHLRDFHKEDLVRRGVAGDDEFWRTRHPKAMKDWWRCNRCLLTRVDIAKYGFECPNCRSRCEVERQKARGYAGGGDSYAGAAGYADEMHQQQQ